MNFYYCFEISSLVFEFSVAFEKFDVVLNLEKLYIFKISFYLKDIGKIGKIGRDHPSVD